MRSTKFYQIISELNPTDLNRFEKFLQSPYFNINPINTELFKICQDLHKSAKAEYTKLDSWNLIKPKEEYDDVKFRKYLSELLNYYLSFSQLKNLKIGQF